MARGFDMPKLSRTKKAPDPEIWDRRIRRMFPGHAWEQVSIKSDVLWCQTCGQKIWRDSKPVFPAGQVYFELVYDGQSMGWTAGPLVRCEEGQVRLVQET